MAPGAGEELRRIAARIEQEIRELKRSGELRGLPGEGLPLPTDPDADAGEAWAARHLARTTQARPAWLDLRGDVAKARSRILARARTQHAWLERREELVSKAPADRIVAELRATREVDARVRAELAAAVEELNALVRRHNLHVPPSLQLPVVVLEDLLEIARAGRR